MAGFDLNALCMRHVTGNTINENIHALPGDFITEARALGAETETTAGGFQVIRPFITEPEMLKLIPSFGKSEIINGVIEKITRVPKNKKVLLKLNAPYSILTSVVKPDFFYRWYAKYSGEIHSALCSITASLEIYTRRAVSAGVNIISLADPYANSTILGERRFKEFSAAYLIKLLQSIKEKIIIHICPHSSILMVKSHLLKTEIIPVNNGYSYINALIETDLTRCFPGGPVLLGNQCIYSDKTDSLIRLFHTDSPIY